MWNKFVYPSVFGLGMVFGSMSFGQDWTFKTNTLFFTNAKFDHLYHQWLNQEKENIEKLQMEHKILIDEYQELPNGERKTQIQQELENWKYSPVVSLFGQKVKCVKRGNEYFLLPLNDLIKI